MEITRRFTTDLKSILEEEPRFIQIVLGPRQVGKTTGMRQILSSWAGTSLYVSANNEVAPGAEWLRAQWLKARLLPGKSLLVIDEIQDVADWSSTVKGLWDEDIFKGNPMRVVMLGSSSLALQYGFTESLAGRFELHKVHHWSFAEMKETYHFSLETYLEFGGYPAPATLLPDVARWEKYMLDSIVEPVIEHDILAHQRLSKPALFRQLFELVMDYPAQVVSYQKLLGQLQDKGNAATMKDYCTLLEQSFLVKSLRKFSTRNLSTRTSSPKLIPLASALVRASTKKPLTEPSWRGRVFECVVLAHLSSSGFPVYYWSEGHAEVDAVIMIDHQPLAIEIKSGRKRARNGLTAFKARFPTIKTLLLEPDFAQMLLEQQDVRDTLREIYERC